MRGRRRSWTDADLIASVAESTSMAQVLRRLGLRAAGGNYEQVRVTINSLLKNGSSHRRKPVSRKRASSESTPYRMPAFAGMTEL